MCGTDSAHCGGQVGLDKVLATLREVSAPCPPPRVLGDARYRQSASRCQVTSREVEGYGSSALVQQVPPYALLRNPRYWHVSVHDVLVSV
eukprot:529286-Rhodomonas_salina.2